MTQLSALGSRQYQAPSLNADARQNDAKSSTANAPLAGGKNALDAVSLSKNGLDLSTQGLAKRADELGSATVDAAQNFMTSFAQSLFGDAAKGATLSFDEASVSAQSGFSALARHSEGPNGVSDGAAFSLNESSHFIGKGTIKTADGQSFAFEIEVQYESRVEAAASRSTTNAAGATPGRSGQTPAADAALPSKQLPDLDFGGDLGDLFKLIGRYLQGEVSAPADANADAGADGAKQGDQGGTLSLRLLNLVNHATLLDAAAPATDQRAKAKAVADAYGAPAPTTPDAATTVAADDAAATAAAAATEAAKPADPAATPAAE